MKNVKLSITSYIENLDDAGLPDGEPETTAETHKAHLLLQNGGILIAYEETTDSGKLLCDILIHESEITVSRKGAIDSRLVFNQHAQYKTVYSIPPYKFDMEITTLKKRGNITEGGGEINIIYLMTVGGAAKRCRMKISVSEV